MKKVTCFSNGDMVATREATLGFLGADADDGALVIEPGCVGVVVAGRLRDLKTTEVIVFINARVHYVMVHNLELVRPASSTCTPGSTSGRLGA